MLQSDGSSTWGLFIVVQPQDHLEVFPALDRTYIWGVWIQPLGDPLH